MFCARCLAVWVVEDAGGKVHDGEGQDTDAEADDGVENGFLGFFNFGGFAGRGHVTDATDNDKDNGDKAEHANYGINDGNDYTGEGV